MNFLRNYYLLLLQLIIGFGSVSGQDYSISEISSDLRKNANAIIRLQTTDILLEGVDKMTITEHIVITVMNKRGLAAVKPFADYSNSSSIREIEASVYDKKGKQIKKYKKKDFMDVSVSGTSLYTDSRALVLEYTPAYYPFTFEFKYVKRSRSTGFLPSWDPSPFYRISTEYSSYTVNNPGRIPLTVKAYNLDEFNVETTDTETLKRFTVKNLLAIDREPMSPHYTAFTPVVRVAPLRFELEGKYAQISSWKDFGLWQDRELLKGRSKLPASTISKVDAMVANVSDPKEKAKTNL